LPFRETFLGREDPELTARLLRELPGILNWSLDGLDRLEQTSEFSASKHAGELIENMRAEASPVRLFVEECCTLGGSVEKQALYAAWCDWCARTGNAKGPIQAFGKNLRTMLPELQTSRPRGGSRKREWTGVSLSAPTARRRVVRRKTGPHGP